MGTNRKKKGTERITGTTLQCWAWSPQAESSVLPHIALNYSLQWLLPYAELHFHQLPSLTGFFNYKLLGLLKDFFFLGGYYCKDQLHVIL